MKTRAQDWSRVAYERVSAAKGRADSAAKYKTSCNKMPGLIHQSGLLQALVFQVARDEAGARYVDDLAAAFFCQEAAGAPKADHARLIRHAQGLELQPYMSASRDIADIAQWFRRFAQIELGTDEG